MTTLDAPPTRHRQLITGCSGMAVVSSATSTLLSWALAHAYDVDLVVRSGGGTRTVGWPSVLVASTLATLAGLALLTYLEARRDRGLQVWTGVATGVFLASLLAGPVAATGLAAGVVLGAMHTMVWLVLLETAWRCRETTLRPGGESR